MVLGPPLAPLGHPLLTPLAVREALVPVGHTELEAARRADLERRRPFRRDGRFLQARVAADRALVSHRSLLYLLVVVVQAVLRPEQGYRLAVGVKTPKLLVLGS